MQQSVSAGDYLTPTAPDTPLAQPDDGPAPLAAQHHLAILIAPVLEIDWLALSASGHRHARIGPESWERLTP